MSFIVNQFGKRISLNKNAQYENCLTVKHENLLNTTSLSTTVSFLQKSTLIIAIMPQDKQVCLSDVRNLNS